MDAEDNKAGISVKRLIGGKNAGKNWSKLRQGGWDRKKVKGQAMRKPPATFAILELRWDEVDHKKELDTGIFSMCVFVCVSE